jgi:hypothetical protein
MTRGSLDSKILPMTGGGVVVLQKFSPAAQGKMKMTWENIAYDQGGGRWTSLVVGLGGGEHTWQFLSKSHDIFLQASTFNPGQDLPYAIVSNPCVNTSDKIRSFLQCRLSSAFEKV